MKIKFISFDFWNTLFEGKGPDHDIRENKRLTIINNFLETLGYNFDKKTLIQKTNETWEYFVDIWENEERTLTTKEILQHLFSKLKVEEIKNLDHLIKKISNLILKYPPSLTEDILYDLIPRLSKNYKLFIISDTALTSGKYLKNILANHNLLKYFDNFSFSDEIGRSKPHRLMFLNVLGNSKNIKHLLHIGDIGRTDIKGAKKIGASAIRYKMYNDEPLSSYNADFVMKSWEDFPELLDKIQK
ncbi:MAG: HAD family hydrolase [Candidatus Mcinerneyibacterium aminivorans]|uniref:HAD family hydrolase n=1 Tax=Candidatus Mcinerneyibacterium aminivorans TaxID=2703815 RepID=A0A5D0MID2_9BACT|nr:MAG: HAD family hydrolase [Candidatus Mcinerneyibacterium aminivorans]